MTPARFQRITRKYPRLRIAVVGDFCLDRYLEIDPTRKETSIETGLPVHNVVNVRAQPGGAGTILNNLAALGIGTLHPIGFCGMDGEGYELARALRGRAGVNLSGLVRTRHRRTFTYCKPLVMARGKPPAELSRLDSKNWSPTPAVVERSILRALRRLAGGLDALIVLDQVDVPGTGVITQPVIEAVAGLSRSRRRLIVLADSRRGLRDFPKCGFKMNQVELASMIGAPKRLDAREVKRAASRLAKSARQPVFVTLAEAGMVGADARGRAHRVPALPVRGPVDIVGAGDAVTANLTAALAAGAEVIEALELANAAASIVIHQLGTTGTAGVGEIGRRLNLVR